MATNNPVKQRRAAFHSQKISEHAAKRLVERMGCKHPVRHVAKVKREGRLLWQAENGDYALGRLLGGKVPYMYVFSADGWLKTVIRKGDRSQLEERAV